MSVSELDIIFTQRHPILNDKDGADSIWRLIYNSYIGGKDYFNGNYLIQYPKESNNNFNQRRKRSVYFNQVSPIVDMLSGMLFLNVPKRTIPDSMSFLKDKVSRDKGLDEFMRILAAYSLMFTVGVLVDMPRFDPEKVKTKRDAIEQKIQPYAVLYLPFKIRDFNIDENGDLDWVLLDNSYYDHSDPFQPGKTVELFRLWTRTSYRDFQRLGDVITDSGEVFHNLGVVPFRFCSWRDDNNDFIGETIFEDIAMISKLIYNSMSYMDEMLASGTFKMLSYPTLDGTLPPEITEGGLGPLSAIPYNGTLTNRPEFIGAELTDVDSFIKSMSFYMAEILKKVGLDTDATKEFVKSGAAKKIDFQKMRSLLEAGAMSMSKSEEWIFETAARWIKKTEIISSEYTSDFSSEELQQEVSMLMQLLVYPVESLRQNVLQVLVKKLLSNNLTPDIIEKINEEIKSKIKDYDPKSVAASVSEKNRSSAEIIKASNKGEQANGVVKETS